MTYINPLCCLEPFINVLPKTNNISSPSLFSLISRYFGIAIPCLLFGITPTHFPVLSIATILFGAPKKIVPFEETSPDIVVFTVEFFVPVPPTQSESLFFPLKFFVFFAKVGSINLSVVLILTTPLPGSATIKFPSASSTAQSTPERPRSVPLMGAFILKELSSKIKILAGTSPSPEPGGIGFA